MNLKLNYQKHKNNTKGTINKNPWNCAIRLYNKVSGVLFWDEANLKVCTSPHFVKFIRILSMYNAPYPFCPSYLYRWARQKQLKVKDMQNIGSMLLPGSFAPYVGQIFLKERSATTRLNLRWSCVIWGLIIHRDVRKSPVKGVNTCRKDSYWCKGRNTCQPFHFHI